MQKFCQVSSRFKAAKECPWAVRIVKVCGGYMCFSNLYDYALWSNQS